jgi:hypothetical protein
VIDHLVYATANLADSVDELNSRFGVALTPGGRHVRFGTRNFLADLGDSRYLEVIGPDPEQPTPDCPRPFGIDNLTGPRLVTWAARVKDLDEAVRRAQTAGTTLVPSSQCRATARTVPGCAGGWRYHRPPVNSADSCRY